jgi:protein gp37
MSDLFHEEIPLDFVKEVFAIMREASWHTFQVLTKRHERLEEIAPELEWPDNVWIGVSVENQYWAERRIPCLTTVPAVVRFLSVEPLLRQVDLRPHLDEIDWVIVGGESGPHARPIQADWVRRIRDDCIEKNVAFFFKQWGGRNSKAGGRVLDGRTWDELPRVIASRSCALPIAL